MEDVIVRLLREAVDTADLFNFTGFKKAEKVLQDIQVPYIKI